MMICTMICLKFFDVNKCTYHVKICLRFSVLSGLDSDLVDGGEEDDEYDVAIKERRRNKADAAAQQGAIKDKPSPQSPDMR